MTASDRSDADPSSLSQAYRKARRLAALGQREKARLRLQALADSANSAKLRSLALNDLAVIDALEQTPKQARFRFKGALKLDPECVIARRNLKRVSEVTPPEDSPIRVALLSFLFNWPSTGGGIVHTVELIQFLQNAKFEVHHIFARKVDWGIGQVTDSLPFSSQALEFSDWEWNAPTIQAHFREAVEAFDPDAVIITDSWNSKPILAEAVSDYPYILRLQAMECLCPLNNLRLIPDPRSPRQCPADQLSQPQTCLACLREHGPYSGELHRLERALCGVEAPDYYLRLTQAFRDAAAVLVVNPPTADLVRPFTSNVRVVSAGMDAERFPDPARGSPNAAPVSSPVKLLFAGLVHESIKGFDVLCEACAQLWGRRQDFELWATAEPVGPQNKFTNFVGWRSQTDLPQLMQDVDIVVVPTIAQDGLGRTAVEAMAAARPVVASRIGGLPFTVSENETGLLAEPGDPADLAKQIECLLDDPDLRKRMGQAGRKRFEANYDWNVIIERHYRPLLVKRKGRKAAPRLTYAPQYPNWSDPGRLMDLAAEFFELEFLDVEARFEQYAEFHRDRGYERTLGEWKTLCFEEAFLLSLAMEKFRPRTIVEFGTRQGASARRLIDLVSYLDLDAKLYCFDNENLVEHFRPGEARLIVGDLTGAAEEKISVFDPDLIFLDVHTHPVLRETISSVMNDSRPRVLAIHDCLPGLCNPRMTLARNDANVTSATGVWERHVLAELFDLADPLDEKLDCQESAAHRLRIFPTRHGLALLIPKTAAAEPIH